MRWNGGRRTRHALAVGAAVLLVAGVLAAGALDTDRPTTIVAGGRVAPAGVSVTPFDDATTTTAAVTTSVRPTVAPTSAPSSTTTTQRRATTTTSTTLPPAVTSTLPPTTVTTIPLPSRWSGTDRELTVSVRMEPAAPVAGEPVRFVFDVSAYPGCCPLSLLSFGDGSPDPHFGVDTRCVNVHTAQTVVTHTYAAPGAYRVTIQMSVLPCPAPPGAPEGAYWDATRSVTLTPCVGVGPGPQARACAT